MKTFVEQVNAAKSQTNQVLQQMANQQAIDKQQIDILTQLVCQLIGK